MSHEIVVAEPIYYETSTTNLREEDKASTSRSITTVSCGGGDDEDHVPEPYESERLPASLVAETQRFLRVANLIEREEPRIAYLCKYG